MQNLRMQFFSDESTTRQSWPAQAMSERAESRVSEEEVEGSTGWELNWVKLLYITE